MNRDDIIRMAREAGDVETDSRGRETFSFDGHGLERFANLVAAAEREACAEAVAVFGELVAHVIRARGEEPKRHPGYIAGDHWLEAAYTRVCTGESEAEVMADYGWSREK